MKERKSMNPSLVILAAGMGSRYGGVKQIDQFGPNGETILDYSIFDAIQVGLKKIVFVIRRELEADFKAVFNPKLQNKIEVHYVFQELDNIPPGFSVPPERKKPWGTAHAVMITEPAIDEPFAVINADDFYGRGAYRILFDFLKAQSNQSAEYAIVGYRLDKTLSDHGAVSRGVCQSDESGYLQKIVERTKIYRKNGKIVYLDENQGEHEISGSTMVSMNMMGFTPSIFKFMNVFFKDFLEKEGRNPKAEFFLPWVLDRLIQTDQAKVKILPTNEQWFGVTYKDDKPIVQKSIRDLIVEGKYPENLWDF
ncbi:sugar phosphate nucleotidyltransferase [Calditrichota bacterium LG25]